jgi:hypothetical protein
MRAHGSEWHAGYDEATRDYESILRNYESGYRWMPVMWVLMFALGVVAGFAMAVAR